MSAVGVRLASAAAYLAVRCDVNNTPRDHTEFSQPVTRHPEMRAEFTQLPIELLDAIVSETNPHDLLALCQTTHKLYNVCLRRIYQRVSLHTPVCAVQLFKTLISNQPAAAYVKSLVIDSDFSATSLLSKAFMRLMQKAMLNLNFLQSLDCPDSPDLFSVLAPIHFPCLKDCLVPLCADVVAFLSRHTTLEQVDVWESAAPVPPAVASISLPALRKIQGTANVVSALVQGSLVNVITIIWPAGDDCLNTLAAIDRAKAPLREVQNLVRRWDPALLLAFAGHLRHLRDSHLGFCGLTHLGFFNLSVVASADGVIEAFYEILGTVIVNLPHLLDLTCIWDTTEVRPTRAAFSLEFGFVRAWGALCTTLRFCTLVSNTMWVRELCGLPWFAREMNGDRIGSRLRSLWQTEIVVGAPTEFPVHANMLEEALGKEEWQALIRAGPGAISSELDLLLSL
ncbi:hypothetical protein B0H16DRAFT_1530284 [Mycena metata]|uniref:F-box domain-containing protein n=1 Tax=Mycena metata TaxID=1033252 RepID=A0AAD7JCE3_9AGAR|nr:hypothetical protein B0H16DRAFT_1530284 [Mycena metata]